MGRYSVPCWDSRIGVVDSGEYNNLHTDIHALEFDPAVPGTLFIASSGGIASASNVKKGSSPTFESDWNRELFNLEFFDGSGSVSFAGLIGGAAQDQGVLTATLPGPWTHTIDCASSIECWGQQAMFAEPGPYTNLFSGDLFVDQNTTDATAQSTAVLMNSIPLDTQAALPVGSCNACGNYSLNVAAPVANPSMNFSPGAATECRTLPASA